MTKPIRTASSTLRMIFESAEAAGITQVELAAKTGKNNRTINSHRAGRMTPSILTVEEIAQALGYRLTLERI